MFGYVVPLRGELKVWELDAYQAAYCGLCHTLGRRYGFLPRLLLSYDFAFLAMLLSTESGGAVSLALSRASRSAGRASAWISLPMRA